MLVILVGLNGDAGQRGIRTDIVRLAQESMPRRKTAGEQLQQVDLATGCCQCQEIQVVNMDIAFAVRLGVRRVENKHLIELFGAL